MTEHVSLTQLGYEKWLEFAQAQTIQHVQQNVLQYYPELAAQQPLQVVMTRAPRRKRYTVILDLAVKKKNGVGVRKLIAKAYRLMPKGNAEIQDHSYIYKSRREFEVHQKIYEYFQKQDKEFSVVKPLDYVSGLLCLIIERADGYDLGSLIHQTRYSFLHFNRRRKKLGAHFQRAGTWLALFHSGFASDTGVPFDPSRLEAQVQRYCERLASAGVAVPYLNSIQQRLQSIFPVFAGVSLSQALLHGDLKPCHIFVTNTRVIPIDFGNVLAGVTYDEVARMLAEIQMVNFGLSSPLHLNLVEYLQRQFLQGYFGEVRWQPLLRFYYVVWLCAKWLRCLRKHKWMLPFAKQTNLLIEKSAVRDFVNRTYVTPWFHRLLISALDSLEKEIRADSNLCETTASMNRK